MSNEERNLENNTARLIQAGLGAAARLDPLTKKQTWKRLAAQLNAKYCAVTFPDRVLVFLGGVFALMATWLAVQTVATGMRVTTSTPCTIMALIVTLNLVMVPVAGFIIVRRRRHA